jgi:hypothetical protein
MPWQLIAIAFGWRAANGPDRKKPLLVVWHPGLRRHFAGTDAWKRAVRLSVHAPDTSLPSPSKVRRRS